MQFSSMLTDEFTGEDVGIELCSRTDGGFHKPKRLKADIALCASSKREMQHMVDLFSKACKNFGFTNSIPKTVALF